MIIILLASVIGGYLWWQSAPETTEQRSSENKAVPEKQEEWRTYRNSKYGVSFQYPEGYSVGLCSGETSDPEDAAGVGFDRRELVSGGDIGCGIGLSPFGGTIEFKAYIRTGLLPSIENAAASVPVGYGDSLSDVEIVTLGDQRVAKIKRVGSGIVEIFYFIENKTKGSVLSFSVKSGYERVAEQMLDSVQFFGAAEQNDILDLTDERLRAEFDLLRNLTPEAQAWFTQSIKVRAGWPDTPDWPNKYFQRDRDGDGFIDQMDERGYLHIVPNRGGSGEPASFYRYLKDCRTRVTVERQEVLVTAGYDGGFVTQERPYEDLYEFHCFDGTFDTYYVDSLNPVE